MSKLNRIIEARDDDLSVDDLAFLDQLAELTRDDVHEFDWVRAWYESDDRLRVPATFHSYAQQGVQTVDLAAVA